jgi:hypothetical protein
MQAAKDREGDDPATCVVCWHGSRYRLGKLLSDPLMGSCLVEVGDIRIEETVR